VEDLLDDALRIARRYAGELGCAEDLERLPALLAHEGGAGRQRRAYEVAGMDALLRELTRLTAD
jgi:gamma-glutamyl:cysteine ligase YbdK (ATP-grasp superfamily)